MSRMLMSVLFVSSLTVAVSPLAIVTPAWGDTLTLDSFTTLSIDGTYVADITAAGNLDWAVSGISEKAGGTAIATLGYGNTTGDWLGNTMHSSYPTFSFTDGDTTYGAASQTGVRAYYRFSDPSVVIDLSAGSSGTVTVWSGTGGYLDTYTATLGALTASYTQTAPVYYGKAVFSYHTDTAQQLTWNATSPNGGNSGIFAVAVSTVPEPGSIVLLAMGLMGLLCYAWRKR